MAQNNNNRTQTKKEALVSPAEEKAAAKWESTPSLKPRHTQLANKPEAALDAKAISKLAFNKGEQGQSSPAQVKAGGAGRLPSPAAPVSAPRSVFAPSSPKMPLHNGQAGAPLGMNASELSASPGPISLQSRVDLAAPRPGRLAQRQEPGAADYNPAKPLPNAPAGPAPEISRIQGLDDPNLLERTTATQLNFVGYDPTPSRKSMVGRLLVTMVLLCGGTAILLYPQQRGRILEQMRRWQTALVSLVRHPRDGSSRSTIMVEDDISHSNPSIPTELVLPKPRKVVSSPGVRTCPDLMDPASAEGLTYVERLSLSDCYQLYDDSVNAETTLRLATVSARPGAGKGPQLAADNFLNMESILIKEAKIRAATQLVGATCIRWEATPTCVGRAMLVAERHSSDGGEEGLRAIFVSHPFSGKTGGRLLLAGAQVARDGGNLHLADQRYAQALSVTPLAASALRKQIYETQAFDLLQRGDVSHMKALVTAALNEFKGLDAVVVIKLRMLQDIANTANKSRTWHTLLTREDVLFRLRADFTAVDGIGVEALRNEMDAEFRHLLSQTHDFYLSHYQTVEGIGRRLTIWDVRMALKVGESEKALQLLGTYSKTYGEDQLSHHLRGVAYATMADGPRYQILAAQEFQDAMRSGRDWEIMYALGATLIRGGKDAKVAPLIRDLTRLVTTPGQRYWLEMLTAEWYIAQANYRGAQTIISNWRQTDPTRVMPMKLLLQLYQKTGKTAAAQTLAADLERLTLKQHFASSAEGLASPLGFMAIGRRPAD